MLTPRTGCEPKLVVLCQKGALGEVSVGRPRDLTWVAAYAETVPADKIVVRMLENRILHGSLQNVNSTKGLGFGYVGMKC